MNNGPESVMASTTHDGDTATVREPGVAPRVGQFYLDVPTRRMYCLNETARQMRDEGVPLKGNEPSLSHLRGADGTEVPADRLPLWVAAHEARASEGAFVLSRPGLPDRRLFYTAAPLKDGAGLVRAVLLSVIGTPPPPDWQALAGLAHDLRTPLQTLGLVLYSLDQQTLVGPQRDDALARLRAAAERAQQIGKELLDWCRAPGLRSRPAAADWFPLEPMLLEVLAEQRPGAAVKGLALATAVEGVRGWQIRSDRVRLGRVLANLLVNAVRYTPGGGRVSLAAVWEDRGSRRFLVLEVADTGAGISREEQESIFNAFERGQAGREADSGGSGIGLSVVDRLTQELGMRCEVQSEAGQGSHFRVLVPQHLLRMAPTSPAPAV
jgi:hypothetical protein